MTNYCGPAASAPWDAGRWPNFTPAEIACPCCGEIYIDPEALDSLQRMRGILGGPLRVTSGHRCAAHNKAVDGASHSVHLALAFDLALSIHPRHRLLAAARQAGFLRFGLMEKGLHVDTHPLDAQHAPMWTYGARAREAWRGLYPENTIDIGGR